jgi:hypothetical protein
MGRIPVIRIPLLACAAVLALVPSLVLAWEGWRIMRSSDAELLSRFNGAGFEDVFGFGFWTFWGLLAIIELAAVLGLSYVARGNKPRRLISVALLAFVGMSAFGVWTHTREYALWEAHTHQQ